MTEVLLKTVPGTVHVEKSHQRSASPRIRTAIGGVHSELRAATRNDHALIDRMLLSFDLGRLEDYRAFLNIHFAALLALRMGWRPQDSEDFEQMLRSLQADLETLGAPTTAMPIPACVPASPCSGMGIAYVVRGSRLGAAVLRRGVVGTLSTSYLDFVPALSWETFLGQLESIADDPNGTDEAIRAARSTFNESDGPSVKEPTRRGFGSVMIERIVPFDLQGTASVCYLPAGLEAEFFTPERYLAANLPEIEKPPAEPPLGTRTLGSAMEGTPLLGSHVLLLEDNLIVALEAEDLLRALGAASVVPVSSLAGAISLCDSNSFDFAVLDINLGFENSLGFADRLRRAKVPFVFASGYGDHHVTGESRISELIVAKPYDRESLSSAIALTLRRQP